MPFYEQDSSFPNRFGVGVHCTFAATLTASSNKEPVTRNTRGIWNNWTETPVRLPPLRVGGRALASQ